MTISANRSQLVWMPVLGWVLVACALSSAQAQAPTATPAHQTLDEQTPYVDIPDTVGSGAYYQPNELGVSLGAFTLFPALEVQTGFDNNVYATNSNSTTAPVGSLYALVKPTLELKSEWLNHSLRVLAGGAFGVYPSATSQNYWNGTLQADGRLDIREDLYVTGLIGVRRSTEPLGTPNTEFATAPTVVDSIPIEFSLYQRFNRFFYQLTGSATRYWYYDNSIIGAGGLPAASRNMTGYEERLRLGYEVTDDFDIWVQPGLQQAIYEQYINVAGQQRDSTSWMSSIGFTKRFSEISKIEGSIGYQTLSYLADGATTPATIFGLTGSWNGYQPLTLRPAFIRTINQSAYSNYSNYISSTYGFDFIYDIHDAWQAVGGTSLNTADYTPANNTVGPRTDYYWRSSLGLLYSLRPQVQLGPLYERTVAWTTDLASGGPQYTRDQISVRLVTRR